MTLKYNNKKLLVATKAALALRDLLDNSAVIASDADSTEITIVNEYYEAAYDALDKCVKAGIIPEE